MAPAVLGGASCETEGGGGGALLMDAGGFDPSPAGAAVGRDAQPLNRTEAPLSVRQTMAAKKRASSILGIITLTNLRSTRHINDASEKKTAKVDQTEPGGDA